MRIRRRLNSFITSLKRNRSRSIIITVAAIGMLALFTTSASTFFISKEAESGNRVGVNILSDGSASGGQAIQFGTSGNTSTCGRRIQNYDYQVPFGNASWNIPICDLPRYGKSNEYARRFFEYGNLNDGSPQSLANRGRINIRFGLGDPATTFARAVYKASDATTTRKVRVCLADCSSSNFDGAHGEVPSSGLFELDRRYFPERQIPWNPNWVTATAGDNEMIILNESNGELISLTGVRTDDTAALLYCGPIEHPQRLCVGNAKIIRDHSGKVADYRTYEGSTDDRGGGISYYATLTTPDEVAAGEIRHALGVGMFNTAFGPECTAAQLGTSAEGTICGTAVAPAAKFEWERARKISDRCTMHANQPIDTIMTLNKTIPEGMRFGLDISDTDINNWIASRGYTGQKANTARIFAVALREYGFIPLDTSCNPAGIQVSSGINPGVRDQWKDLGITQESDQSLLSGLITQQRLFVVEPPVNQCINGSTSKYYCKYTKSSY